MATNINKGSQYITFDFKHPAKGADFNRILRDIIKPGIYKGLTLNNPAGNTVEIATGSLWMNAYDANNLVDTLAIHAEMQTLVSETINQTTAGQNEVLYFYYEYVENTENYFDIRHTNRVNFEATGPANAIVIGDITYDGGGNITGFDYSSRTWGTFSVEAGYSFNSTTPFSDVTDNTKKVLIDPSSVTTATTRTLTVADTNMNLNSGAVRTTLENIDSGDIHTTAEGIVTGTNTVEGVNVTNAPDTGEYYFEIDKVDSNNITVKAIHKTTNVISIKNKASGSWGSWTSLQVSGKYAQLDVNGSVYEAFEAIDISGDTVHDITRRGPFHGIGVTNEPADKLFHYSDYIPVDPAGKIVGAMAAVVGDVLWVFGGETTTPTTLTSIRKYVFSTGTWSTIGAVLPAAREFAGISKDGTDIYIMCGALAYNGTATNTIYKFDTLLESVSTITPASGTMPSVVGPMTSDAITLTISGTGFTAGDKIIAIAGGFTGATPSAGTPTTAIYWYNITQNTVITKTAVLPLPVGFSGKVTYSSKLFILGGAATVNTLQWRDAGTSGNIRNAIYNYNPNNPTDDASAITTYTSTITDFGYSTSVEINGYIYSFGGTVGATTAGRDYINKFDPLLDSNTVLSEVLFTISYGNYGAAKSNLVCIFGGTKFNTTASFIDSVQPFAIVNDWNYEYIQKNASTLQVIATDAYGSWRGNAVKVANNIDTTAVWSGWTYTNKSALQWYDLTLLNGWVTYVTGGYAMFSKDEYGFVTVTVYIDGSSSTGTVFATLPDGYRPSKDLTIGAHKAAIANADEYLRVYQNGSLEYNNISASRSYGYIIFKAEQ